MGQTNSITVLGIAIPSMQGCRIGNDITEKQDKDTRVVLIMQNDQLV